VANGSEPWRIPDVDEIPELEVNLRTDPEGFFPYLRNENLARPWAVPGTPGLEHRIGGLEKSNITGNVSHDPDNHDMMVNLRAQKIKNIADDIPDLKVEGDEQGDLLVLGWGGTYGTLKDSTSLAREKGYKVSHAHLKYLNPMPKNTGEVLSNFSKILIPEINLGQLAKYIRSEFLIDVIQFNKVRGLPLNTSDVLDKITDILGGNNGK
jgi:2-oxoglutarate ferredoxin oxidoreductase subunit alpha